MVSDLDLNKRKIKIESNDVFNRVDLVLPAQRHKTELSLKWRLVLDGYVKNLENDELVYKDKNNIVQIYDVKFTKERELLIKEATRELAIYLNFEPFKQNLNTYMENNNNLEEINMSIFFRRNFSDRNSFIEYSYDRYTFSKNMENEMIKMWKQEKATKGTIWQLRFVDLPDAHKYWRVRKNISVR